MGPWGQEDGQVEEEAHKVHLGVWLRNIYVVAPSSASSIYVTPNEHVIQIEKLPQFF